MARLLAATVTYYLVEKSAMNYASKGSSQGFVYQLGVANGSLCAGDAGAHLVHHVGDRGAASRVHHRHRAAPSAPETNLPVGNRGNAFRTRQSEADAVSQGIVSTTSMALDCSSKIRSMVSGLS